MNVEQEMMVCDECANFVTYCFCYCPYCGDEKYKNCKCNLNISEDHNQVLSNKKDFVDKSFSEEFFRDHNDDWWRLEKWQVGRRNFS